jgi:uncharacterized protein YoxC
MSLMQTNTHNVQIGGRIVRLGYDIEQRVVTVDTTALHLDDLSPAVARQFQQATAAFEAAQDATDNQVIAAARRQIEDAVAAVVLSRPYRDAAIQAGTRRETRTNV